MRANVTVPVIVSITTLPSRVSLLRPTLETLLNGIRVPDRIRIVLPEKPLREDASVEVPGFLTDQDFHRGLVEVVRIERDFGPGSKLLGTIGAVSEPTCLILADDDVRYRRDFVSGLVDAQLADPESSFSYFTYSAGGIRVGQGCDGFSFWTPNVAGIRAFFDDYIDGTDLIFHDDLWISFYLATRGIKVRSLHDRLDGSLIYEQVHEINALRNLDGVLEREEMNVRGYRELIGNVRMPWDRRASIRATEIYRRFLAAPARRVTRQLRLKRT